MFPNVDWDFYKISMNPQFTMQMLVEYYNKNLALWHISRWMPLTVKFVKEHSEYAWDYALLSANPSITLDDILENPDIPWRYDFFSSNINLPLWYVRENMEKGWSWYNISRNKGITMTDIHENMDLPWRWFSVSYNVNITIEFLENHQDLPICWDEVVSKNMKIDVDILSRHSDKNWDYKKIFNNPYLTIDILRYINSLGIINNPHMWSIPTKNPVISIQDIEDNPDLPWDNNVISCNPNFSLEDCNRYLTDGRIMNLHNIMKNMDTKIDNLYNLIIANIDSIIMKLMTHFPEKFGVRSNGLIHFLTQKRKMWKSISENPNITISFIKKHARFIDFNILSSNKFKFLNRIRERSRYFYILKKQNSIPLDIVKLPIVNFL